MLFYAMLCYAIMCYAMLLCAMLCYAMLCDDVLCYAMPYYTTLCYAMLRPKPMARKVQESIQSLYRGEKYTLDVVLLHSPRCWQGHCSKEQEAYTWQKGWLNLEKLYFEGIYKLVFMLLVYMLLVLVYMILVGICIGNCIGVYMVLQYLYFYNLF
jgi:hypothetical protein